MSAVTWYFPGVSMTNFHWCLLAGLAACGSQPHVQPHAEKPLGDVTVWLDLDGGCSFPGVVQRMEVSGGRPPKARLVYVEDPSISVRAVPAALSASSPSTAYAIPSPELSSVVGGDSGTIAVRLLDAHLRSPSSTLLRAGTRDAALHAQVQRHCPSHFPSTSYLYGSKWLGLDSSQHGPQ